MPCSQPPRRQRTPLTVASPMRHHPGTCPDLADAFYGAAWREHIMPHRAPLGFRDAKALAHRAFDAVGLPRPFVKRMPLHYTGMLGYATPEWEIFLHDPTWDDTVLHEAAHLCHWLPGGHDPMEGHGLVWFSNYVCLLLEFGAVPKPAVNAFALQLVQELGPALPKDFEFACRVVLTGRTARWANLRPGDPDYDVAVRAGCRLFSRGGGEPVPLRNPLG